MDVKNKGMWRKQEKHAFHVQKSEKSTSFLHVPHAFHAESEASTPFLHTTSKTPEATRQFVFFVYSRCVVSPHINAIVLYCITATFTFIE